jgi:alpha-ketoglutarate-dependent taurine dioxygenase
MSHLATRARRRRSAGAPRSWVEIAALKSDASIPVAVTPKIDNVDLVTWCAMERNRLNGLLHQCGALLFRGFDLMPKRDLTRLATALGYALMPYSEQSSPRRTVGELIYTSTDHPANEAILLHNENSYAARWPAKILFCCERPATAGGETPIADCRKILERIPAPSLAEAIAKGILYLRNFIPGCGVPWQKAFQTPVRDEVERYCRAAKIAWEWRPGGELRTWAQRPAVRRHPSTREPVWFNQALLFHASSLSERQREVLLRSGAVADLPQHAYYGDGSSIETSVVNDWAAAQAAETVTFSWRKNDVLLLDNMLVGHGRAPYAGDRSVIVAMANPVSADEPSLA